MIKTHGQIVEIVEAVSPGGEKRSHIVREPERSESVHERLSCVPGDIEFSDKHRNIRRDTVISPHLENVSDQSRFFI